MTKFQTIKSNIAPLTQFDSLSLSDYTYAVYYWSDGVEIKECSSENKLETSRTGAYLLELRAFNENQELYLIRVEDGEHAYQGRIRQDETGDDILIFDEEHKIWGDPEKNCSENGSTTLKEDRGIEVTLPISVDKGKTAFITVRNYFNKADGDLQSVDWRFVAFSTKEATPYLSEVKGENDA